MDPTRISKRLLWRALTAFPALISLVSAITLLPGVVGAAPKAGYPALPTQGGSLASYSAVGTNTVIYHNGPVFRNPDVKLIFEGTWGSSDMQTVKQYFTDVSGSPFEAILTQYSDTSGPISDTITVSGSNMDSNFFHSPHTCADPNSIIDTGIAMLPLGPNNDIYSEIQAQINANHWSTGSIFFVFTPPGYNVHLNDCNNTACGYHSSFTTDSGITNLVYAVIPWAGGSCTDDPTFPSNATALDKTINTASHEQFEAITNPTYTVFQSGGGGWYNNSDCNVPCEIGDKCSDAHPGVFLNGHFYNAMQGEFSNIAGAPTGDCEYIAPPPVVNVVGGGAFDTVWEATGGATGPLGVSTDSWHSIPGGQAQDFQHGSIYWSSATGTYEVQGAIYNEYVKVMGGPTGALNFPTSNEQNAYNGNGNVIGRENAFRGTGCTANNQGSIILYSSSTGAHMVIGCIYQKYVALGGTTSLLGLPTSDEQAITNSSGTVLGHASYFQGTVCGSGGGGGGIFDAAGAGIHEVHGCIYQVYLVSLGGPNGVLSFPTSDEMGIANGRVSYFYGNLCGSRGPNNSGSAIYHYGAGNYMVGGCIYNKYWNMSGPNGILGFPTSNVTAISGGYVSYFAGESCNGGGPAGSGSAILSSSTGTFEVQGCIYHVYEAVAGGPAGMGFPTSDEVPIHNSSGEVIGRVSYFAGHLCNSPGNNNSGSAIYNEVNGPTVEVQGCIYYKYWHDLGGPWGTLGFPVSNELSIVGGRVSYFTNHLCGTAGPSGSGSAIYFSSNGTFEVQGCIYNKYWHDLGGPAGCLGFPTTDEFNSDAAGDRESDFQHGYILWQKSSGTIFWSCS